VGAIGRWEFGAITLVKSGTPFDVLSGSDGPGYGNVDGAIGDRPNLFEPAILGRTINNPDTATQMLPRSAFAFMRPSDSRAPRSQRVSQGWYPKRKCIAGTNLEGVRREESDLSR
jgi:hypothetical protein